MQSKLEINATSCITLSAATKGLLVVLARCFTELYRTIHRLERCKRQRFGPMSKSFRTLLSTQDITMNPSSPFRVLGQRLVFVRTARCSLTRQRPPSARLHSTLPEVPSFDYPAIENLKTDLNTMQPCFGLRGDEVDVLVDPIDFHTRLLVSRHCMANLNTHP